MKLNEIKFTKAGKVYAVCVLIELIILVIISVTFGIKTGVIVWAVFETIECTVTILKYGFNGLRSGTWMIQQPKDNIEIEEIKW